MDYTDFTPDAKTPLRMVGPNGYALIQDKRLVRQGKHWVHEPSGFFYPTLNGCNLVSSAYDYAFSFEGAFQKLIEHYPSITKAESNE